MASPEGKNEDTDLPNEGRSESSEHKTLSFAEFLSRGGASVGIERALLLIPDTGEGQQVFPITRNPTVIGRSNNADLVLGDAHVSDFHARIIKHSFGYTVEDMGSAEGTYLSDRRISHARLVDGDTLRIGETVLTFLNERAQPAKDSPKAMVLSHPRTTVMGVAMPTTIARDIPYPTTPVRRADSSTGGTRDRLERLPSEEAEPSIEDLLVKLIKAARYLRRNGLIILACVLPGIILAAISFKLFPPVRAAQCMVTLHPAPKTNPIESAAAPPSDSNQFFAGAERAFTSRETILSTLSRLGVQSPTDAQAEAISKRMKFESLGNNTYVATFTPALFSKRDDGHVRFLDAHVKNYIETEIEKKLKVFVAEVEFLRSQTKAAEDRLREISKDTVAFREAHSDHLLAQGNLVAGSPAQLESRRIALTGEIDRLSGELMGIRSQLARGSALSQAKAQAAQTDRDALTSLNRKLTELRAQGFADGHPDVQRLLSEQVALQKTLDERLHSGVTQFEKRSNVAYDSLQGQADRIEAQLRAARSERGFIESTLRSLREVNSESPKVNARIEELRRMKEDTERQHALLFDRLEKAQVQLQLERVSTTSRFELVVPVRLESPPGKRAVLSRLSLGLGIGVVVAALLLGIGELRRMIARVVAKNVLASALVIVALSGQVGCAHEAPFVWAADLQNAGSANDPIVHPQDTILVEVEKQPTLSGEFVVRNDGHYTQPMVGSIRVANLTTTQVAGVVANALKTIVISPVVSVWITKTPPIHVSVLGEVKTPGRYEMLRIRTLPAALAQAGWVTEFAHSDRLFVIRPSSSDRSPASERIRFRVRDIVTAEPHTVQFQLNDADVVVVE